MSKIDELIATTKLNDLINKKEEEKASKTVLWILAVIGAVAAVAAIAYAVYCFFIWKTLRMILTMISMMTSSMTKIRYRFRTTKQVSKKQAEMPAFLQDEVDDGWTVLCSVD